ncbi:patatin-like phospholipase family protein [Streptomyces piniterrae]|uniref:Patatin-like phospholipase family protein n=1 Tax=Streptomyces piniterrae TaxID=2571125 RepID=A0A4U0NWP8_9ACTN|nr:patatin-like phospholipase family protein [Streptomyces piniterrae]TJZ59201.1 patatin-like phospholipase family protein [Streptomyces piniterrae]
MAGTALVLGGGGLTGIGWEIGFLAGLAEAGLHLADADVVIGTSAGSIVGAHVTSGHHTLEELYARQLVVPEVRSSETRSSEGRSSADRSPAAPPSGERSSAERSSEGPSRGDGARDVRSRDGRSGARMGPVAMARFAAIALRSRDTVSFGARMGRLALAARTAPEAEQRAAIARTLTIDGRPHLDWPARRLVITAVEAATGRRAAFDDTSGVGLVDAVSASCAVPGVFPPVTIDGRRWIDGGVHSSANVDLAAGYGRVVVIAPMAVSGGPIAAPRTQGAALARQGARVCVITPDRAARSAFGRNVLDPTKRADAARAGRRQSVLHAEEIHAVWSE